MPKYDYRDAVTNDVRDAINEYCKFENVTITTDNADELKEIFCTSFWCKDSVTGNGSGSYTFSRSEALENLNKNLDLLADALEAFDTPAEDYKKYLTDPEAADVVIRCYFLNECVYNVIDEILNAKNE